MKTDDKFEDLMMEAIEIAEKLSLSVDQAIDVIDEDVLEPDSVMANELTQINERFKASLTKIRDFRRKFEESREKYL